MVTQATPKLMTKEQAERVCEEAEFQGWGVRDAPYETDAGQVEMQRVWLTATREYTDEYWVDLKWPGILGPKYHVRTTDEWRKLKAKVDEIKQIVQEAQERGWPMETHGRGAPAVYKTGKFGLMIEVYPPGTSAPYPVRVGGMRTWRKVIREYTPIEGSVVAGELDAPS